MIPGSAAPILLSIAAGGNLQIGQAFQGGYYAGTITYNINVYDGWLRSTNGPSYHLVVAPKANGDSSTILQYKTSATCDGLESTQTSSQSRFDGYHNTYTSVVGSSSSHPAANYCQPLSFGGYSDWYLPAIEEANLAFGNLRQLANWQSGGSESFRSGTVIISGNSISDISAYWTSTGDSCENTGTQGSAAMYNAGGGYIIQGYNKATTQFFVRAIRRVAA
jgi:hypothetical protein